MTEGQYEKEEFLEQDEEEAENAGRTKSVVALGVLAILVVIGLYVVNRLRDVSAVQDCMMTRATNCNDMVAPPTPSSVRP